MSTIHGLPSRRLLVLALAALALLLGACGSSGSGSGEDATKVLDQTFGSKAPIRSGKLDLAIAVDAQGARGIKGPINVKLSGPFVSKGRRQIPTFDLDVTVSASGQSLQLGAISTGTAGYIRFQGQDYQLSDEVFASFKKGFEDSQAQAGAREGNQTLATLGVDPRDWLRNAKVEGDATVGGTETTHVTAEVDIPKLLDGVNTVLAKAGALSGQTTRVPRKLTDQQRKSVEDAVKQASFEVYAGKDDKILRKLVVNVDFAAAGGKTGTVEFSVTISDLNQPQTITAPPNAKPLSELTSALGASGLGGLTGGGTTSGGDTSGSGVDAYAQCLQDAKGDIPEQQKCSSLLTP